MIVGVVSAEVVKLVDTHVSGACGASCAGSSPAFGTITYGTYGLAKGAAS